MITSRKAKRAFAKLWIMGPIVMVFPVGPHWAVQDPHADRTWLPPVFGLWSKN